MARSVVHPYCWNDDTAGWFILTTQEDKKETKKETFLPKASVGLHEPLESTNQDSSVDGTGGEGQKGLVVKVVLHHH